MPDTTTQCTAEKSCRDTGGVWSVYSTLRRMPSRTCAARATSSMLQLTTGRAWADRHKQAKSRVRARTTARCSAFEKISAKLCDDGVRKDYAASWWERRRMRVKPKRRKGLGIPGPLSRGDHHDATPGPERARLRLEQLAQAPRGSQGLRAHVADRSILDGLQLRRLEGAGRRPVRVEAARELSAHHDLATADVAAQGGMAPVRPHQRVRSARASGERFPRMMEPCACCSSTSTAC